MKNIVLIGMRGSGKSTIGRQLARRLCLKYIDTDRKIEIESGQKIPDMIATYGWEYFRRLEKEMCRKMADREDTVIATGGGVVLDSDNIAALKTNGTLVFLLVEPQDLRRRLAQSQGPKRPSLTGQAPADETAAIWEQRKPLYFAAADLVVGPPDKSLNDSEAIEAACEELIGRLPAFGHSFELGASTKSEQPFSAED
jgi:shikimate kinase